MTLKKKITAICVFALLITAIAVNVISANDTVGNIEEANARLDAALAKEGIDARMAELDSVVEYLATVAPDAEGLADFNTRLDTAELGAMSEKLAAVASLSTPEDLDTALVALREFNVRHAVADSSEYAEYLEAFGALCNDTVEKYLEKSKAATTAAKKHEQIDNIYTFNKATGTVLNSEASIALNDEAFVTARLYLDAVKTTDGNAKLGASLRKVKGFLSDHTVTSVGSDYEAFTAELETKEKAFNSAFDAAKSTLTKENGPTVLIKPDYYALTFDRQNEPGVLTADKNVVGGQTISYIGKTSGMDGDNNYYTVRYEVGGTHFRTKAALENIATGGVIEFDFTTESGLPAREIWFEDSGKNGDYVWSVMYIRIQTNGNICNGSSKVLVEGAVTPGQWVHISFAIDSDTSTLKTYVDYELVDTVSLKDKNYGYSFSPNTLIIGANPTNAGGDFCIDNLYVYAGTSPMDREYISSLTERDLFAFYGEEIGNTAISASLRGEYYDLMTELLPNYYDVEAGEYIGSPSVAIKTAVQKYLNLDIETLLKNISAEKLTVIEKELEVLLSYQRGEANYTTRKYYLDRCKQIFAKESEKIEKGERYDAISVSLNEINRQLGIEDMGNEFVGYVNQFYLALDIDVKKEYCTLALERINILDFDYLLDEELFPNFCEAYEKSKEMLSLLADYECLDNSKRLYSALTFLKDYPTEEDWRANYDYLLYFVSIANEIIESGNYDPYYRSLDKMIEDYGEMRSFFFEELQLIHIAHAEAELEKYAATEQYFTKYAISATLDDYFKNNIIDENNTYLAELIALNSANLAELIANREEYEQVVRNNTAIFIQACEGLLGSIDYVTMKRLYNEAAAYYYTMDVSDAAAKDALLVFITRRDEIRAIEKFANDFILSTALLNDKDTSKLEAIIACSAYVPTVEKSIGGVTAALELYKGAIEDYNDSISTYNQEINLTKDVVLALTNNQKSGIVSLAKTAIKEN